MNYGFGACYSLTAECSVLRKVIRHLSRPSYSETKMPTYKWQIVSTYKVAQLSSCSCT